MERIEKPLGRLVRWLDSGAVTMAASLLFAIVVIDGLSVVFRYVLGSPLSWSEEVMRYCNVWLSFIGAISAFAQREHMTIDLGLANRGLLGRVLTTIGLLVAMTVAGYMVVLGIRGTMANMAQVSPSAQIVMAVPYAAVPVAGAGIFIISIYFVVLTLRSVENKLTPDEPQDPAP